MVGTWCEDSFVKKIDLARGGKNRSQFCREALTESLIKAGFTVEMHESYARSRDGKGGPKPKSRIVESYRSELRKQKKASSKATGAREALLDEAEKTVGRRRAKS